MIPEIFSKVLNMSLTASLVIGVVIAARFALRKSPKIFSYALWAVVLFRLLCPVSIPSPLSAFGFLDAGTAPNEGITTSIEYVEVYREVIEQPQAPAELPELPEMAEQVHTPNAETPKETLSLKAVLPWLWLAGVVGMMLFGIATYVRFRVHLTGAVPMERNVYLVDHIDSAFVAGVLRPRIYLPSDLPENEMSYILEHEKYHLRRLDHVAKHLAFLALSIHWFNPLVWVAFILSGKDMEMSCDEAVIQKLGEGIRADYSVSLLNLATGRKIIAGSPLAFGEGDTKGRVLNMARWKQPKKWVRILSFVLCIAILTACAANPDKEVVISKNDGSFDANVVQSATNPTEPSVISTEDVSQNPSEATEDGSFINLQYTNQFTSTDGTVAFRINIAEDIPNAAMPVVEVSPHYLTSADAERMAKALFGKDAVFYEAEPLGEEVYSKAELQKKINRLLQYDGHSPELTDGSFRAIIERTIEQLTLEMETAPSENPHRLCQWDYKKASYYYWSSEELAKIDTSQDNDQLVAVTEVNGIPYLYTVATRNRNDFKLNNIYVQIGDCQVPISAEYYFYQNQLCQTEKPDNAAMEAAVAKAEEVLNQMGLGDWRVDECIVEVATHNEEPEYILVVNAVPVFENVAAIRRNQLENLKSEASYASNYYLTDAQFKFNISGDLIAFSMCSPIDVSSVINNNVQTLSFEELITRAENQLALSDYYQYDYMGYLLSGNEDYVCQVDITDVEYGLTRVKVPDTDERYYYVPAMIFKGSIQFLGKETGVVYEVDTGSGLEHTLLILNAIDGSVINATNG